MNRTEMRNPKTKNLDKMSAREIAQVIQEENKNAVSALDPILDEIASVIDRIAERMRKGGRLFYVGCGTSGRLGVLDASECPPTFGVSPDTVVGIIAGGDGALRTAKEGSEDDEKAGETDLKDRKLQALDTCIGISAAGGAKYVTGAVAYAKTLGCFTVSVTCNEHTPLGELADVDLVADTGEEVVTGSTRMKAGSAQKMILNMISTGVMVKLGYVYENMMINLRPTNEKLKRRMARITAEICGCNVESAEELLNRAAWNIKDAVRLFHNTP